MKRILLAIVASIGLMPGLMPGPLSAQTVPQPKPNIDSVTALLDSQRPDVTLVRGGYIESYRSADRSPLGVYQLIENVIENKAQQGDEARVLGIAVSDQYDMLDCGKLSKLSGYGATESRIVMRSQHDLQRDADGNTLKPGGPSILPPDSGELLIEHITLENIPANIREDGALIGWSGKQNGTSKLTIRNAVLISQDWGLYDWSLRSNRTVILEDVQWHFARMAIALCHSNATYDTTATRCKFVGDANTAYSYGASNLADTLIGTVLSAALQRAGMLRLIDCEAWLTGMREQPHPRWGCLRIAAVTDQYFSSGHRSFRAELKNFRVYVGDPGLTKESYDIDIRYGQFTVDNSDLTEPVRLAGARQVVASQKEVARIAAETAAMNAAAMAGYQQTVKGVADANARAGGGSNPDGTMKIWTPPAPPAGLVNEPAAKTAA